jgi:hypothetical protein
VMLVYLDSLENLDVMVYLDYLVWRVVKVTEELMAYLENQEFLDYQVCSYTNFDGFWPVGNVQMVWYYEWTIFCLLVIKGNYLPKFKITRFNCILNMKIDDMKNIFCIIKGHDNNISVHIYQVKIRQNLYNYKIIFFIGVISL